MSDNTRRRSAADPVLREQLQRARSSYARRDWADAFRALSRADQIVPLEANDLERLATAAYLIGRDDGYLTALDRAYRLRLETGEHRLAVRCAFWIGLRFLFRGETSQANGWLARARRLLQTQDQDCAEWGYLLVPTVEQHLAAGDHQGAATAAARAAEIGERCRDPDLTACARHLQGRVRIKQGRISDGLALLDEVMLAVAAGELSPIMSGLLYCSVIDVFQQIYALDRAREWTLALARWCEAQPQLVAFTGVCQVHRAEILQRHGAWREAMEEARLAGERCQGTNRLAAAAAAYQQAEIHRLRGECTSAETGYASASRQGLEPQPGLALLRLAQGRGDLAVAAIRRAMKSTSDPLQRARLLPACAEIMVAAGDIQAAREACHELQQIAVGAEATVLGAIAAHAHGAVELAAGNAEAALASFRLALNTWLRAEMPYEAARARVLISQACRAIGDIDGATLELKAARAAFEQLGAAADLASMERAEAPVAIDRHCPLSPRELQVLRLIATGKTNKTIAAELRLSPKTVDRHVSNIFTKLDVPSRAAATASAYQRGLV